MDKFNLPVGTKLRCNAKHLINQGIEVGDEFAFLEFDECQIPKNRQNAVMTWYPDKPLWTDKEYVEIRKNFMMIKLEGVERSQWLKDFDIIS